MGTMTTTTTTPTTPHKNKNIKRQQHIYTINYSNNTKQQTNNHHHTKKYINTYTLIHKLKYDD